MDAPRNQDDAGGIHPFPTYRKKRSNEMSLKLPEEDDVIGRAAAIRLEKGDTLPDVARHFSLGINEISLANPGVDVWVPEAGTRIVLPLQFILPDAPERAS